MMDQAWYEQVSMAEQHEDYIRMVSKDELVSEAIRDASEHHARLWVNYKTGQAIICNKQLRDFQEVNFATARVKELVA